MRSFLLMIFLVVISLWGCGRSGSEQSGSSDSSSVAKHVVAFVYHRFGDDRFPTTNVTLEHFRAHLNYLQSNDFQVLTLADAIAYLKSDEPAQKTAVITVDDAYKSFYQNALPMLEDFGFPASLYVNTKTVGGADYMSWSELRDAADRGLEIGNHTHSHAYFLNLPDTERYTTFREEIVMSQELIQQHLNITPVTFAYPYGELDAQMKEVVKEAGFQAAAAQNSGVVHSKSDWLKIPRFPMSEYYSAPKKFAEKAEMLPIVIANSSPDSFIFPQGENRPALTLNFAAHNLLTDQLQCFMQGNECDQQVSVEDGKVTLKLRAKGDISDRRRTLYTITVPDTNGKWHWYSHLWINAEVN